MLLQFADLPEIRRDDVAGDWELGGWISLRPVPSHPHLTAHVREVRASLADAEAASISAGTRFCTNANGTRLEWLEMSGSSAAKMLIQGYPSQVAPRAQRFAVLHVDVYSSRVIARGGQ